MLIRGTFRRLCDGEPFFFVKLLELRPWRSDEEILSQADSYRTRLLTLYPELYATIITNQHEAANESRIATQSLYLEMVQFVTESIPRSIADIVCQQLLQLNIMNVSDVLGRAALDLKDDQYRAYIAITSNILQSHHTGTHFFVTGPGGTGKSFLLKALQAWCDYSGFKPLLLAPTGLAANNVSGKTIHSTLSLFTNGSTYNSSIFSGEQGRAIDLRQVKVLIIDECSMVDSQLFGFVSSIFARLHQNSKPFGNIHVILFGDLMQLPPVSSLKIFHSPIWRLFHPLFLRKPQRQVGDLHFFNILNKIRFGIIDQEVKDALQSRAQAFNPADQTYVTTFLCSLKANASAMNRLLLSTLPSSDQPETIFHAVDYENGLELERSSKTRVFKKGTNFPDIVTCVVGAKVMFLTNGMIDKGISNGTCGVIVKLRENGEPDVAFPTKDGIRVSCLPSLAFIC
jgi:hypothetical protein